MARTLRAIFDMNWAFLLMYLCFSVNFSIFQRSIVLNAVKNHIRNSKHRNGYRMRRNYLLCLIAAALVCAVAPTAQSQEAASRTAEIVGKAYRQLAMNAPAPPGLQQEDRKITVEVPMSTVEVTVVAGKDTLRTETNVAGAFRFKGLAPGRVTLSMADTPGLAPFSESFELMPGENVVIIARQTKEELEAAVVSAESPIMTMRGDTLVYHMAALNVQPGDYAVDLLKQMPGVEVRNGQIYVAGEAVRRTYVNGALIFGLNPMAPMENLQAEQIIEMEVYDERNPQEKLDGVARRKERVMNVRTRNPIFSTTDLQVRALAGADQQTAEDSRAQLRYTAGVNAHFFSELKQLWADAVTGNVGMHSSALSVSPTAQSTYLENTDLALGYNRYWENALLGNGLETSYRFGHQWTRSRSRTLQEYFETAGIPARLVDRENTVTGRTNTHSISTNYNYRTGKVLTFGWSQRFQLSRDETGTRNLEQTTVAGGTPMLRDEKGSKDNRSWTLGESLTFNFRGKKPLPSLSFTMQLGQNKLDAWDLDTLASSYSKRYLTKAGDGLSQSYNVTLGQAFLIRQQMEEGRLQRSQLQARYMFAYSSQHRRQEAYDLYGSPDPVVNAANTFDFTYASLRHSLDLQFSYYSNAFILQAGLTAEAEKVTDHERIPAYGTNDKPFYRLLPSFNVSYKGVSLSFISTARIPSTEQLRRWVDDANPLSLIAGNPDLKQSISYTLSVGKNGVQTGSNKHMLLWNLRAQFEDAPIVSRTLFFSVPTVLDEYGGYRVAAGSTLLRSENADYRLDLSGSLTFSSQWGGGWKVSTRLEPSFSFRSTPQYFAQVLERTREYSPMLRMHGTMFPLRNLTVDIDNDIAYVRAVNASGSMDRQTLRNQLIVNVDLDFLKNAFLSGRYSWVAVRSFDLAVMNNDVHRLDLSVGVNLLGKRLKIALSGIDLLQGGSFYSIAMGPSSVTQSWRPVYGRYFLLDISYRFNNSGSNGTPFLRRN